MRTTVDRFGRQMPKSDFTTAIRAHWGGKADGGHRHSSEEWLAKYAQDLLSLAPAGGTLVDVGCGSCQMTTYFAKSFDTVYAVDFSETMLSAARERVRAADATNIKVLAGTMQAFPAEIRRADVVLSNQVLQYMSLEDLAAHLRQCRKVLTTNGVVGIANIPNVDFRRWYEKTILVPRPGGKLGGVRQWMALNRGRLSRYFGGDFLWDGIGNWFSRDAIKVTATKAGFDAEFRPSPYYEYRFHARLRLH
jgi:ubiquinone/menaquinone biosynthesis C-methylase UbiE